MQAQRKLSDPAPTASPVDAEAVERAAPIDYQSPTPGASDHPMSPAIMLQEQLAARFAAAETGTAEAQHVTSVPEFRLPMALRIGTIVTLSLALWGGIFLAATALTT